MRGRETSDGNDLTADESAAQNLSLLQAGVPISWSVQSDFRKTLLSVVWMLAAIFIPCGYTVAKDRTMIDPNSEKVIVSMRGVNFDIPLGYFFHDAAFSKGEWPVPSATRSVERSLVITALIDGLQPWTREKSDVFSSGQGTMRIRIDAEYPANWLENYLRNRHASLYESNLAGNLEGLRGYGSKHGGKNDVFYLLALPPQKPYFVLRCNDFRPDTRMCKVTFDYRSGIVVEYAMPVAQMKSWRSLHQSVVALLNRFISN